MAEQRRTPPKAALVVIYNHRYERNIDHIERIYRGRFSRIFHLMPFYSGDRPNVIPVYGNSYYFQGFVAQALRHFVSAEFTHYFFVADDLVLNPAVNEHNFPDVMGLPPGHCFFPGFHRQGRNKPKYWGQAIRALRWRVNRPGLEIAHQIPAPAEARARLSRHKVDLTPPAFERLWEVPESWRGWARALVGNPKLCARYARSKLARTRYELPYPLASGYSDIFVVTADVIHEFARLCGIFAAADLFVEHAIPTAMALSADWIAESPNLKLKGKALWTREQLAELDRYGKSIEALLRDFPPDQLYIHPIKLSQWLVDLEESSAIRLKGSDVLANAGFRQQIADVRCDGADLCLRATGGDPIIELGTVSVAPNAESWAVIDITVPQGTLVQLFFQTADAPGFTEQNSARWRVREGRHRLVSQLVGTLNGRFRLDPGTTPGDYRVHSLEFRQSLRVHHTA